MFTLFMILLFINFVNEKIIFIGIALIATFLPDIDSGFSSLGKQMVSQPVQLLTKHRGIMHSLSFAILISIALAFYFPVLSFGFFIGYGVHILADSFTKDGVQPFWPLRMKSSGFIATGGRIEETIFFSMIFINAAMFFATLVF